MAQVTLNTDFLNIFKFSNAKTYIAGIATIITTIIGYNNYIDPNAAYWLATAGVALTCVCLRLGVKKAQDGEVTTQDLLTEVLGTLVELKDTQSGNVKSDNTAAGIASVASAVESAFVNKSPTP